MGITICRKTERNEHKSDGLPTVDMRAIVTAVRAAGLDPYFNDLGAAFEDDGLLVSDLPVDAVEAAIAPLALLPQTREIVAAVIAHAREHDGNTISFVQYSYEGQLAISSHPDSANDMDLANGNAFALFDALGMKLEGYSGEFRAADLLNAARDLSPFSPLAIYRDRLIGVCEHALSRNGADALIQAA